jgi:hypothetical protein
MRHCGSTGRALITRSLRWIRSARYLEIAPRYLEYNFSPNQRYILLSWNSTCRIHLVNRFNSTSSVGRVSVCVHLLVLHTLQPNVVGFPCRVANKLNVPIFSERMNWNIKLLRDSAGQPNIVGLYHIYHV